jgi:hypothetical protein
MSALGALAGADAGHEDEDGFKSNWMVADVDCRVDAAAGELPLRLPERLAMPASAQVTPAWTQYRDCESR